MRSLLPLLWPLWLFGCELVIAPGSVPPPTPDACQRQTCESLGKGCGGPFDDGCGATITCAGCAAGSVCDPASATCVGCLSNPDCAQNPDGHFCLLAQRRCVACLVATDCDASGKVGCEAQTHRCAPACTTNANCAAPTPICDQSTKTCVFCRGDLDCQAPRPRCRDRLACVPCLGDADCPGQRCDLRSFSCVQCLSGGDCPLASPKCSAQSTCVECLVPADCASGICGADGRCTAPVGAGENCTSPIALGFSSGTPGLATASGDTTAFLEDGTGSCGGGGPDVVYSFQLSQAQDVDVVVWPQAAGYQPVVFVRSACADSGTELGCGKSRAVGEPASVSLPSLAAGTYYVWVDGLGTSKGAYSLSVSRRGAGSALPETCVAAQPLVFDAKLNAWAAGTTSGAVNDSSGTCGGNPAPDLVYFLRTTTPHSLVAIATALGTAAYAPVVYLRDACGALATQVGCAYASTSPGAARLEVAALAAGDYYLWVDGLNGTAGRFALWVSLGDPLNDTCDTARDVSFDAGGKAHLTGSTSQATNDTSSSCGGTGPDVYYRVSMPTAGTFTATVGVPSGPLDPVVSLRRVCTSETSEIDCVRGPGQTLTITGLAAGTYWLVVDGYGGSAGPFTLDLAR